MSQPDVFISTAGYRPALQANHQVVIPISYTVHNAKYNARAGRILGIIQIVVGAICVLCGVITTTISYGFTFGLTIVCGLIYIVSGVLGTVAVDRSSCKVVGFMVMSIISAFLAPGQFAKDVFFSVALGFYGLYGLPTIISALAGLVEIVVAILSAAYCCQGATCCKCCRCCRSCGLGCCGCCCCISKRLDHGMQVQYTNQPPPSNVYTVAPPIHSSQPLLNPALQPATTAEVRSEQPPPYPYNTKE